MKSKKNSFKWIYFVSRRFSTVDSKSSSAATSRLSALGICFGVMALITVMSVMNGFQLSFIDAILEISSFHIRIEKNADDEVVDWCKNNPSVKNITSFYEAQGLMAGNSTSQSAALIRCVDPQLYVKDTGFRKQLKIISGSFDLADEYSIVIGSSLARSLGVHTGSTVNILALSGSSDVSLISESREFTVTGIFSSGYSDINETFAFISRDAGKKYLGKNPQLIYGIKLRNSNQDAVVLERMMKQFPELKAESWRVYNSSFFGALRVEKNMLLLLVLLIFVVVAVNIYNGMRKMVYERSQEIAVLTALGAEKSEVQNVFLLKGLETGIKGAVPGLLLGIFLSVNMQHIFRILSKLQYYFQYAFTSIFMPGNLPYISENLMFNVYAGIPARMNWSEILFIFFFGIFSSVAASWFAGRKILKLTVVEVLRNE